MREGRPWQLHAGAFGLGGGRLGFGATDRSDAAFAAGNPLRRLMQIADRALAADRTVIGMFWLDAETVRELDFRVAVAPTEKVDDVERADLAKQLAACVFFRAPESLLEKRERLEARGDFLRAIDDFADADNDGDAVFGE